MLCVPTNPLNGKYVEETLGQAFSPHKLGLEEIAPLPKQDAYPRMKNNHQEARLMIGRINAWRENKSKTQNGPWPIGQGWTLE